MKLWQGLLGVVAAGTLLVSAGSAQAFLSTFTASGPSSNGPVSASATISTTVNSMTISLSDLLANPTSAGQEVSGIQVTFLHAPTSDTLFSEAGQLVTIASGTATNTAGPITHWGTVLQSGTIFLATVGTGSQGGQPQDLIIGPGPYSNANSSIINFNPQISGTGTFKLTAAGLSSGSVITGVEFEFGTTPDLTLAGTLTHQIPKPAAVVLFGSGLLGLAAFAALRRRSGSAASGLAA
jgi:hypothetical protein